MLGGQPAAALGAEGDVFRIPHVGMPALSQDLLPQLGTGQPPVAQHDHGHFLGDRWNQFPQQFHYWVHPGPGPVGAHDAPGHGNGASPVDHADDDGGGLVAFEGGVHGQGQPAGMPPGQDPAEQGREAEGYIQLGLAGTGPVAAVVEPLSEILAEAVPSAPGREGRRHGVRSLDTALHNTFHTYLMEELRNAPIGVYDPPFSRSIIYPTPAPTGVHHDRHRRTSI